MLRRLQSAAVERPASRVNEWVLQGDRQQRAAVGRPLVLSPVVSMAARRALRPLTMRVLVAVGSREACRGPLYWTSAVGHEHLPVSTLAYQQTVAETAEKCRPPVQADKLGCSGSPVAGERMVALVQVWGHSAQRWALVVGQEVVVVGAPEEELDAGSVRSVPRESFVCAAPGRPLTASC